ncbi:MAG: NmrA/HSCARG family protein [Thermoplasmata archaeon]
MSDPTQSNAPPSAESLLVLVSGIGGQQGGHVARHLLQRGHRVRGLSRTPEGPKHQEIRSKGVEIVPGSFDDPASIVRAAKGVDAMFLMGTPFAQGADAESRQGVAAVDAAKSAGVPWLVYSSVGDADRQTGIPHFESKFAVEQHLERSGVPHVISAPTSFMENFVSPLQLPTLRQGKISAAISPDRRIQMVALDDLGRFVTHLLENPARYGGKRFNVASDAVSEAEVARILGEASGRKIDYQPIPLEGLRTQNADLAKMFEWFERAGYTADIDGLRREFPHVGWQRFREWAGRLDWPRLLA